MRTVFSSPNPLARNAPERKTLRQRVGIVAALLLTALLLATMPAVGSAEYLVTDQAAAQVGLQRAWFAQVRVDPARNKVVHWLLDGAHLFALTSAGSIQAVDAETGATLWSTEVGVGHAPAAGLAVNDKYLALLGAGRIYIMDRGDGHQMWSLPVGGAPTSAPALSENYAYVTLVSGRVEAYRLDDPAAPVWQYDSIGRTFQSPTATGDVVSWPTDRGLLYVGRADPPRVLFRVETNDEIVTAPAEQAPYLYVASLDGYLYCFHEINGSEQWRYATGFAVTSKPAIVEDTAFVASEGPTLHAVNSRTGDLRWRVDGVTQFVALGKQHTYGMNRFGTIIVLDNASGAIAGRLATGDGNMALVNDKSDRLFLVNDRGLVQCLHEIGADQPTWHRTTRDKAKQPTDAQEQPPAEAGQPGEEPAAAPAAESPFAPAAVDSETDESETDESEAGETDAAPAGVFDDDNPFN